MPRTQTQQQVLERMTRKHGDTYDYSHVVYKHSKQKVVIICKEHREFLQTPEAHIRGQGCPACRADKTKHTVMSRYGVPYASQIPSKIEKTKQVLFERYGHSNAAHGPQAKEKVKQTNLNRYGTEKSLQSEVVRRKIEHTNMQTFGVPYVAQRSVIPAITLLADVNWLTDQYVTQRKPALMIAEELGVSNGTVGNYLRKHKIAINYARQYSAKCIRWLEEIMRVEHISIQHALNGGEYRVPSTSYKADGFCEQTNTIYEFHGDIFHGNPRLFESSDVCQPFSRATAGELYTFTLFKEQCIRELGYNLVVMWEHDFDNNCKLAPTHQLVQSDQAQGTS